MKESKHDIPNIELRSEEVQELMGKIPPTILRIGISIILGFVLIIVILSILIKYPEIKTVPVVIKNVDNITNIKTAFAGRIIKIKMDSSHVYKGDTLAALLTINEDKNDTFYIISPSRGIIYPCNVFNKKDIVEKNTILFVLADSIQKTLLAKSYVSNKLRKEIKTGMTIETNIEGATLQGKVKNIAKFANPNNGTYAITMIFDTPKEFKNIIIWNIQSKVRIRITNQSIFNRFFHEKIPHMEQN